MAVMAVVRNQGPALVCRAPKKPEVGLGDKSLTEGSLTAAKVAKFVASAVLILGLGALAIGILVLTHKIVLPMIITYALFAGAGSAFLTAAAVLCSIKSHFPNVSLPAGPIVTDQRPVGGSAPAVLEGAVASRVKKVVKRPKPLDLKLIAYLRSLGLSEGKSLGSGTYGNVHLSVAERDIPLSEGETIPAGTRLAVKVFRDRGNGEPSKRCDYAYSNRGEAIPLGCRSENLVRLYALVVESGSRLQLIKDPSQIFAKDYAPEFEPTQQLKATIMEFSEGVNLIDLIKKNKIDQMELLKIGREICKAIIALGQEQILHRDLKLENMLIHRDGTVKLCDFGLARRAKEARTPLGTPGYTNIPQFISGKAYGSVIDRVALGRILFQLTYLFEAAGDDCVFRLRQSCLHKQARNEWDNLYEAGDDKAILNALYRNVIEKIEELNESPLKPVIRGLIKGTMTLKQALKGLSEPASPSSEKPIQNAI